MFLVEVTIEYVKKGQCKKLRWQVSNWHAKAISFYKSMGAEIDEKEINCNLHLTSQSQKIIINSGSHTAASGYFICVI